MVQIKTNFYTLTPGRDILFIEAMSSWDERVAREIFKDVEAIVSKHYNNKPWAQLTDARNWELGTPEAAKSVMAFSVNESIEGLAHHAIVVGESELRRWTVEQKMLRIDNPHESKVFSDMEEAQSWLASHGYFFV